ncbi:hypothetical protein AAG570_005139 [Ranatra chinensis]|uniref:Nucleoporin NUP35 n=1 Tax=Ranatra chinensis TaxID=642074 RepID=A0ABD0Y0H9_9HEMI
MEPMALSPSSSPPVSYLPGYLLGGGGPEVGGGVPGGMGSTLLGTPGTPDITGVTSPSALRNSGVPSSPLLSKSSIPPHNRPDYNRGSKAKLDGPPIVGLFDDLPYKSNTSVSLQCFTSPNSTQLDTSQQTSEELDNSGFWIIVFGFPPSYQSHVLSVFSQIGRVLEHSYPTNGNWMFIRYQSRMDVRKALSHDEKVIAGNFMIGVSERRGRPTIKETLNNSSCTANNLSLRSPELNMQRMVVTSPNLGMTHGTPITSNNTSCTSPKIRNLTTARRDNMPSVQYGCTLAPSSVQLYCDYPQSLKAEDSVRNMFYQNKKQETTEIDFIASMKFPQHHRVTK